MQCWNQHCRRVNCYYKHTRRDILTNNEFWWEKVIHKVIDICVTRKEKAAAKVNQPHPHGIQWTTGTENEEHTLDNVVNLDTYKRYRRKAR